MTKAAGDATLSSAVDGLVNERISSNTGIIFSHSSCSIIYCTVSIIKYRKGCRDVACSF